MPVSNPSSGGGGGVTLTKYTASKWYAPQVSGSLSTSSTNDRVYFAPIYIHDTQAFDRIGVDVTVGVAATTVRLGIFSDLNYKPDLLVVDGGTVETTSAAEKTVTISKTLTPGLYWLASTTNTGSTATMRIYSSVDFMRENAKDTVFDSALRTANVAYVGWEYRHSTSPHETWNVSGFPSTSINALTAGVFEISSPRVAALRAA